MNFVVELLLIFYIGAIGGWIIELFYRRYVSQKKWLNPGFLKGPYLPLYGFGVVCLYLICQIDISQYGIPYEWSVIYQLVLITIVMTGIEYLAGIIFIKGMKIKLWDYSDRWGNIQGIICPLYSLFWGMIGIAYYFFLHSSIMSAVIWLSLNPIFSFFVGAIFGIFIIDFSISMNLATKIKAFAKKENIVIHFEAFKNSLVQRGNEVKEKVSFLNPFSNSNLQASFKNYIDNHDKLKDFLTIDEKESNILSIMGFLMSICLLNVISLLFLVLGRKTTKYKKINVAGQIISIIEIISILIFVIIYVFILK